MHDDVKVMIRYRVGDKAMATDESNFGMVLFEGEDPGEVLLGSYGSDHDVVMMVVAAYNYARLHGLEGDVREAINTQPFKPLEEFGPDL